MFTQHCMINKCSKNIQNKLESLGYSYNSDGSAYKNNSVTYTNGENFYLKKDYKSLNKDRSSQYMKNIIDCKENEDLFFAIAALSDNTDINQWFTDGINWKNCMLDKCDIDSWYRYFGYGDTMVHKASVQELIKHFA